MLLPLSTPTNKAFSVLQRIPTRIFILRFPSVRYKTTAYNRIHRSLKYVRRRKFYPQKILSLQRGLARLPTFVPSQPSSESRSLSLKKCLASRRILREYYGIATERELKSYYIRIMRGRSFHREDCHVKFLDLLERRLDTFSWRCGFFDSPASARHGIRRGWVSVNNRPLFRSRHELHDGDYLSLNFNRNFRYVDVLQRLKNRVKLVDTPKATGIVSRLANYKPPEHVPMRHYDMNYTTLTVHYRRSISGPGDMIPMGSVFGPHNDLMTIVQHYWWSYLCKW